MGAPVTPLDDDIGRGEFFVGLIPENGTPWELCRGDEWTGVAEEKDGCWPGAAPKDEDAPRLEKSGRGARCWPYGVHGVAVTVVVVVVAGTFVEPLGGICGCGGALEGYPAITGPTSRFPWVGDIDGRFWIGDGREELCTEWEDDGRRGNDCWIRGRGC